MSVLRSHGFGWVPDMPDHRDKIYNATADLASNERGKTISSNTRANCKLSDAWESASKKLELKFADNNAKGGNESGSPLSYRAIYDKALKGAFPGEKGRKLLLLSEKPGDTNLPKCVDLRYFMSPMEDQGSIGSCTAHAVIGLVEYLQIATRGEYVDASRRFLYKTSRNLLGWKGDTGAYVRTAFKALRAFGVCPESYYPYYVNLYDEEPAAFHYSFGSNYQALTYYRLGDLTEIKQSLAQGYPVAFGFSCFESLFTPYSQYTGIIPYPSKFEKGEGGHAVLAVGYIEKGEGRKFAGKNEPDDQGYIIIRNSWGTGWGAAGYGYIPMSYFIGNGEKPPLADDYWSMAQMESPDLSDTRSAPYLLGHSQVGPNGSAEDALKHGHPLMSDGHPPMMGQPSYMMGHPPYYMGQPPYMMGHPPYFMGLPDMSADKVGGTDYPTAWQLITSDDVANAGQQAGSDSSARKAAAKKGKKA